MGCPLCRATCSVPSRDTCCGGGRRTVVTRSAAGIGQRRVHVTQCANTKRASVRWWDQVRNARRRTSDERAAIQLALVRTLPSSSFPVMNMPPAFPSRSGRNVTVIRIPGSSDVRVQPRRARKFGLIPSNPHVSTGPDAFCTSTHTQMCGFVQSTCLTTPVIVFSVFRSRRARRRDGTARTWPRRRSSRSQTAPERLRVRSHSSPYSFFAGRVSFTPAFP